MKVSQTVKVAGDSSRDLKNMTFSSQSVEIVEGLVAPFLPATLYYL